MERYFRYVDASLLLSHSLFQGLTSIKRKGLEKRVKLPFISGSSRPFTKDVLVFVVSSRLIQCLRLFVEK